MSQNIQNLIETIRNNSQYIANRILGGEKSGYLEEQTRSIISMNSGMIHALGTIGYREIAEELAESERLMIREARVIAESKPN